MDRGYCNKSDTVRKLIPATYGLVLVEVESICRVIVSCNQPFQQQLFRELRHGPFGAVQINSNNTITEYFNASAANHPVDRALRLWIRPDLLAGTEAFGPVDHSGAGLHGASFNRTLNTKPLQISKPARAILSMAPKCVLAGSIQLSPVRSLLDSFSPERKLCNLSGYAAGTCTLMYRGQSWIGSVGLRKPHQIQQKRGKCSENKDNGLLTCVSLKEPLSLAFFLCPDISPARCMLSVSAAAIISSIFF